MPTCTECICCCELEKVVGKMEETGALCITEHEGFDAVCLNRWVLQTAYFQYRQQYGNHHEDTPIHKYVYIIYLIFEQMHEVIMIIAGNIDLPVTAN